MKALPPLSAKDRMALAAKLEAVQEVLRLRPSGCINTAYDMLNEVWNELKYGSDSEIEESATPKGRQPPA